MLALVCSLFVAGAARRAGRPFHPIRARTLVPRQPPLDARCRYRLLRYGLASQARGRRVVPTGVGDASPVGAPAREGTHRADAPGRAPSLRVSRPHHLGARGPARRLLASATLCLPAPARLPSGVLDMGRRLLRCPAIGLPSGPARLSPTAAAGEVPMSSSLRSWPPGPAR